MDARASWSSSRQDGSSGTIQSRSTFGAYAFLITFACAFYLSNASLLLGHYDLGWHLAAGDLIRAHAAIPFQDPWSFTLGDKQWFNLSWLWDVIASRLMQSTGIRLSESRSFGDLRLHRRLRCGPALSRL